MFKIALTQVQGIAFAFMRFTLAYLLSLSESL